jgi:hypothetical protein
MFGITLYPLTPRPDPSVRYTGAQRTETVVSLANQSQHSCFCIDENAFRRQAKTFISGVAANGYTFNEAGRRFG